MVHIYKVCFWTLTVLISSIIFAASVFAERGLTVAVIAHSISTSGEARMIRHRQGWIETEYKQADAILVVCRSGLSYPLSSYYGSIKELDEAADSQLNISGSNFHIYLYAINNDLSVNEVKHIHYPAD